MQPVLTVAQMRDVDAAARATTPLDELVARAGAAVAVAALGLLGGAYGRRVAVVAGPGNNGADGRVAARLLARRGARVEVLDPGLSAITGPVDLVVDAAYGTGFRGSYEAPALEPGTPVLAVDIPSGVVGDTGEASGNPHEATATVTFAALKPGLLQSDGRRLAGRVSVADIGLRPGEPDLWLVDDGDAPRLVPARRPDGNKWDAAVLVVAGSPGMTGAARLCSRAAYRAGSGMVRLGVPGASLSELPASEAVGVPLGASAWSSDALAAAERCRAVVVGPGLGRDPDNAGEVGRLVARSPVPVVVDADGLFALGEVADGGVDHGAGVVLTPHDGEFARLAGAPPGPDRIDAARRLARAAGTVVLVKGQTTAVADPEGRVFLATAGTPALATAGTGDVLSGVIGALVARGVPLAEAAAIGAHVHGRAGARGPGAGTEAGDLPDRVASVLAGTGPRGRGGRRGGTDWR